MTEYHSLDSLPTPGRFFLNRNLRNLLLGLIGVGVATVITALFLDPTRAWYNLLINFFYWMSIGLFGAFFTAIHFATGASWSTPVRRLAEGMSSFLPIAGIIMVILFLGSHSLYEWTHTATVAQDPLLHEKSAYLNLPFFIIRGLIAMGIWIGFSQFFIRKSLEQDTVGGVTITSTLIRASVIFLPLFGLSFTMSSFDFLMSTEPHFFSTIYGIYQFASLFYSGVTMLTIIVILLHRQGLLRDHITDHHLHDLTKWMFAMTVFWAYIAFSQYMLIWYANLPEETFYFIKRQENGWGSIALLLVIGKFILPFFLLISKWQKRMTTYILIIGGLMLAANWVDLFWQVVPSYSPDHVVFGWVEVGTFLGFLGLFALTICRFYSRHPLVPLKDPYLLEGVNHHQF